MLLYNKAIISITIISLMVVAASVFARPCCLGGNVSDGYPYFGIIAGASFTNIGKEQTDTSLGTQGLHYKYLSTDSYSGAVLYGINGGYEFKVRSNMLLSLGLGVYQGSNYSAKGQEFVVNPVGDSSFRTDYTYKVRSTRLMLETQLAWRVYISHTEKIIPFITMGAGSALNYANSYHEADPAIGNRADFKPHSNICFAYQLGAGISYPFNDDNSRLSISYRYIDLGKARFGARESGSAYFLDVGNIKANEIFIGYVHLFNL